MSSEMQAGAHRRAPPGGALMPARTVRRGLAVGDAWK
jgi:hypothetical protein